MASDTTGVPLPRGTLYHFERITDRCHVSDSNRAVVAYALSHTRPGIWADLPFSWRFPILRAIIRRHRHNRQLYMDVMGGGM